MWEKNYHMWCWTAQCEDGTVKCEKKVRKPSNLRKKTVTCDVETVQYEDETVKCEKKNKGNQKNCYMWY